MESGLDKTNPKRKRSSITTKNRIFETAIQLIKTKGYPNVTVDEICEKSGVTKGAFYHHFDSKESIIDSAYIHTDSRVLEKLPQIMKNSSALSQIIEIGFVYAELVQYKGVEIIKQIIRNNLDSVNPIHMVNNFYDLRKRPILEIEIAILRTGQESGEIRDDITPEHIQRYIISSFNGFILDWCYHNGSYNFVQMIQEVWPKILISYKAKE